MANTKITSRVIADNSVGIDALNVTDGTNGQAIVTDGNGTISFADVGIDGIVSSADLQSAKITAIAQRLNTSRNEVSLRYIMTPISQLNGVSMQSLSYASIGDALQTMEHQGSMFLLATTTNNEICGLISARQIAKTLHIPVHITPIAHTFSDVLESVEHPH